MQDKEIYAIITLVSVVNAILVGITGKLGIGVFVCIALEFYMALAIARRIGFKISEDDSEETKNKKEDLGKIQKFSTIWFIFFLLLVSFIANILPSLIKISLLYKISLF